MAQGQYVFHNSWQNKYDARSRAYREHHCSRNSRQAGDLSVTRSQWVIKFRLPRREKQRSQSHFSRGSGRQPWGGSKFIPVSSLRSTETEPKVSCADRVTVFDLPPLPDAFSFSFLSDVSLRALARRCSKVSVDEWLSCVLLVADSLCERELPRHCSVAGVCDDIASSLKTHWYL